MSEIGLSVHYCVNTYHFGEYPFFGSPYDFQRGLPHLKIIGIGPFFFQSKHNILCALGVKIVAEACRAAERVELGPGKNVIS